MIPEKRFWSHVAVGHPDECWPWNGCRFTSGYGRVRTSRTSTISAHRLAWILTNGEIPSDQIICHHCDNPPCCNPAHLFVGTHKDNVEDCIQKGRRARLIGSRHPMARLTESQVLSIRARHGAGESPRRIAVDFSVTPQMVWMISTRRSWSHV